MTDRPRRLLPEDPQLTEALTLIRESFAYMDGIISPASTMHAMTEEGLRATAESSEVWAIGAPVSACMILTAQPPGLYLGKLAVAKSLRRLGVARRLIDWAEQRVADLGLSYLELGTRVELVENQRAFEAMGFVEVAREAHPGFDRPTAIVYRKLIQRP